MSPLVRVVLFGLIGWVGLTSAADPAQRPNVLIIVGDDMGYADVGCHGCKDIPTPHIDSLAKSGIRFPRGYVSGPYCSPTRAGLLTGRYQQRFGHEFNSGGPGGGLPLTETTLADRLKAAGYVTGLVGKWHLGTKPEFHPQQRGFDEFFGFLGGAHTYFAAKSKNILRGKDSVSEPAYLTDAFAREATAFIERHRQHPWFLYVAFNAVHTPMDADDARLAKFAAIPDKTRRTYAAMMSAMDDAVGAVLAKLRETGQEDKTLIVFFSDNGGPTMLGTTLNGSSNAPLRGSKRQTLEGGIRVPFLMSWKDRLPAEMVYPHAVIQLDIAPTALAAAGVTVTDAKFDGVNLLPFLRGENSAEPHPTLYWRFGEQMAVLRGDWKLVRYGPSEKLEPGQTWPKLYNLRQDIGEANDLASSEPEKVRELEAAWAAWDRELPRPKGTSGGQPTPRKKSMNKVD